MGPQIHHTTYDEEPGHVQNTTHAAFLEDPRKKNGQLDIDIITAEAMTLAQEYDQARSRAYCELVAACNVEMLRRRRTATRYCGTAALTYRAG